MKFRLRLIGLFLLLFPSAGVAEDTLTGPAELTAQDRIRRAETVERELQELKDQLNEQQPEATEQQVVVVNQSAGSSTDQVQTVAPIVATERQPDTHWRISGYADSGFIAGDAEQPDSFVGHFNPIFQFQYQDIALFVGEPEISIDSEGETEVELEYAQINFLLHDSASLVVGKYLSPIGQFGERLHPSWINKLADAPAGFGHDGLQPGSDVGIQLRGGVPLLGTVLTYVLAVGNGPRTSHEGSVLLEGMGNDDNSNKSVAGRIGFLPVPDFEVGASYFTAKVNGEEGDGPLEPNRANFDLWGLDAAFTRGGWDLRFEYLLGKRAAIFSATIDEPTVSMLPKLDLTAWYAQAAYRLSSITDNQILENFEPVVRYGQYKVEGLEELANEVAENRFDIGLNYWFTPSIVARTALQWRNFRTSEKATDTRVQFQFAYGF